MINRLLLYNTGGGIGDAIQILPLINTLKKEFNETKFFYLSAHENHFNSKLKDLNCEIETLDLGVKYFGFRWWHILIANRRFKKKGLDSFDLIIDLQSKIRNSIILKTIPHKQIISPCLNFKLSKPKLKIKKENRIEHSIINAISLILDKKLRISEFDINNIDNRFHKESLELLPKNNYVGLSISQGNLYRKKEWPLDNFINLSKELIKKNKIPVFFIEKDKLELKNKIKKLIPDALFPEHESNLSGPALVACLGKRLECAISIDNGVMHMLSLSKVPIISIFGPTNANKFAPVYKKSIILDSKKMYHTNNISSISVADVLMAVEQNLTF